MQGDFAESDARFERATQMQRLLIAHAEDQDRHRPWLYFLQIRHGNMFVDAGNHAQGEHLLTDATSNLEAFLDDARKHDGQSFSRHNFIARKTEDHLDLAYRNLAKLSRALGDESAAKAWSEKLGDSQ